jgi:hypothetical protein
VLRFLMPFAVMVVLVAAALIFLSSLPTGSPPYLYAAIFGGATLLSLLVIFLNARFLMRPDPSFEKLVIEGTSSQAEVLAVADSGITLNNNPMVILTLRVRPQYGSEFEVKAKVTVSRVAVPRVGDVVNVRYDPADPQNLIVI